MPPLKSLKANVIIIVLVSLFITSCTSFKKSSLLLANGNVKNYPSNQPFIYNHQVLIKGNIDAFEKERLTTELNKYWDDSLVIKKSNSWLIFNKVQSPARYDSVYVERSLKYMDSYLKTQGYYYVNATYDTNVLIKKDQKRVLVTVNLILNKNVTIDVVGFDLQDSGLQQLTLQNVSNTLLKKGIPYTKQVISNEIDRLTGLYNSNGYYNFRRDDLYALVDTTDEKFIDLTTDPFKLVQLLDEYNKSKMENPKWKVTIKQRVDTTNATSKKYYFGHIYYYPQTNNFDLLDTTINKVWLHCHTTGNYTLKFDNEIILLNPLKDFTYFKNGEVYDNKKLYLTIDALNKLGPWKQVDAKCIARANDTLDVHISLVPDKKFAIENSAEISRNTGEITSGNFVGISNNLSFRNRNVWKRGVQSFTTLRVGIELAPTDSSSLLQTFFTSLNHQYSIPKKINIPIPCINLSKIPIKLSFFSFKNAAARSLINFNVNYTDRLNLFKLKSINSTIGYEYKKDDEVIYYNPINVELYALEPRPGLDTLFNKNPFLKLSFNTGNVVGQTFNYIKQTTNYKKNKATYFRFGAEWSGLILGLFTTTEDNLYRYIKLEGDYRTTKKLSNNVELAMKFFGGVGINLNNSNQLGDALPFFKQFFVGGPNSMRAWGLRQLGQGSSLAFDTLNSSFKDRFGDLKIEINAELRFNLFRTSFMKVGSAAYLDIGNIWNLKQNTNNPNGEIKLDRFYKDIAIGLGTGLRLDFSIFLIRIDVAYKLKDPAREYNNGWVDLKSMSLSEKRSNGTEVRNAAIQLGIGLPF